METNYRKNRIGIADEGFESFLSAYSDASVEQGFVIELWEKILSLAEGMNASDIHIEPFEEFSEIRIRRDGILLPFSRIQKKLHVQLISSIKVRASLNIAEKRLPQDGHFKIVISDKVIDVRVSSMPVINGEKIVMRILSDNAQIDNRMCYGMSEENYERFRQLLNASGALIYLTGPTGSGKSTTMYMVLEEMASENINICTIEDPVEKIIFGINQMQVNNTAGLTFETGLKAVMRQDPDVIMVGETRDIGTAKISARAAMTGHLVMSTLHTKSAAEVFVRLRDMGMEPYVISSCVAGAVSQRLLRKVCPYCKKTVSVDKDDMRLLSLGVEEVSAGEGCEKCHFTGYSGRIAVHEVLIKDSNISKMIYDGALSSEIENYAEKHGMVTLKESALRLLKDGIISESEFGKVLF